jgi:predicted alpha/beta superfamily hydrolase
VRRAAALALLLAGCSHVRPVALLRTEQHAQVARSNGQRYDVQVALPRGYGEGTERYGVLLVLDADYAFPVAHGIVDHLADRDRIRPLIVVGVAYPGNTYPRTYRLNRTRDYTPVRSAEGYGDGVQDVSGGAGAFLSYLADELLPWLDRTYRTAPGDRTLVGHSYGGLFGTWTLHTRPAVFARYLLVSPSLWYADRMLFRLPPPAPGPEVVLAVGGDEAPRMPADLRELAGVLRARGVSVHDRVYEGENHDTVFPTALTWGLRTLFSRG